MPLDQMLKTCRVDHLGIVVPDMARAIAFYRDTLGFEVGEPRALEGQGIAVAFVRFENTHVELLVPTVPESPLTELLEEHTVNHFLQRVPQGGLHHVCYVVPDFDAVLARLPATNVRVLGNGQPILGASGKRIVFIDPQCTGGTLVELKDGGPPMPDQAQP